jgi:hypothetical protein
MFQTMRGARLSGVLFVVVDVFFVLLGVVVGSV